MRQQVIIFITFTALSFPDVKRGRITCLDLLPMLLFGAAQGTFRFLGCKGTWPGPGGLFTHQHPQILLLRAAPDAFIPHLILILVITLTRVWGLAPSHAELTEFCKGPLFKAVKIPLDASLPSGATTAPPNLVSFQRNDLL